MRTNAKKWLNVSNEEHDKKVIQDGDTPSEDFSSATNENTGDVDTAKPAVAEIPAASEGTSKHTTKEHDHMTVTTSKESEEKDDVDETAEAEEETGEESEVENKDETEHDPEIDSGKSADGEPKENELDAEGEPVAAHIEPQEAGEQSPGGATKTDEMVGGDVADTEVKHVGGSNEDYGDQANEGTHVEEGGDNAPDTDPNDEGTSVQEGGDDDDTTTDKVEETDLATTELDTVSKETFAGFDETLGHLDQFGRMSAALEAYTDILRTGLSEQDGVTVETALAIKVGIESLDESFADDEVVPSMEAFGETSSRHRGTYVALENIKDRAKAVYEAGRRAVEKLFEMVAELIDNLLTGVSGARKRLAKVTEKIDKAEEASVNETTTIKGATRLMIGNEFVGNDPSKLKMIEEIMQFIYVDHTKQMLAMSADAFNTLDKVSALGVKLNGGNPENELKNQVNEFLLLPVKHLSGVPGKVKAEEKILPASLKRFSTVVHGHVLPGNYSLFQYINDKENILQKFRADQKTKPLSDEEKPMGRGVVKLVFAFGDTFRVEFRELNTKSEKTSETYRVPSRSDMQTMVQGLERLLRGLDARKSSKALLKEARDGMLRRARKVTEARTDFVSGPQVADILLRSLATAMTQPTGNFARYISGLVNAYIAVLNHNLGYYTIKGVDVKGKAGEPTGREATRPNASQPRLASA